MKQPVLLFLFVLIFSVANSQTFDPKSIQGHIKTLADDSFQGRGTGTSGEKSASIYIESEFKKLKLQPKGDNQTYFQSFPFKKGTHGEGEAGTGRNIVAYPITTRKPPSLSGHITITSELMDRAID